MLSLKHSMRSVLHYVWIIIRNISVEPMMILFCLGFGIGGQPMVNILYQKVCRTSYHSAGVDCNDLSSYPDIQDKVQNEASLWNLASDGVKTAINIPAILLWSAWADRNQDRKIVILIPLLGFTIDFLIYLLEASIPSMPIWLIIVGQGLSSGFGGVFLMNNSVNAYIATRFTNQKLLAIRFIVVMACVQLSQVAGSYIDAALAKLNLNMSWLVIIGMAFVLVAQLYCVVILPKAKRQTPNKEESLDGTAVQINSAKNELPNTNSQVPIVLHRQKSVFVTTFELLKDCFHVFFKPRPHHKRLFILLIVVATFLTGVSDQGTMSSLNLFLFRRPLNYTFEDFSDYHGGSSAIVLAGTVVSAFVAKLFALSDTTLAILSQVFNCASMMVFGFSREKLMVWISAALNCVGFLWNPALSSVIIKLGSPNEQATLIAGTGIAGSLAGFLSSLMFNAVYSTTEAEQPWVAWVTASCIIAVGLLFVIIVHVGLKYRDSNSKGANTFENAESSTVQSSNSS